MKLLQVQNRINELMSVFVAQVKGATAMGQTDINRVSETVLIPLFAEVYGYKNLKNLNYTEGPNYPGIDLGDEVARVAFQITSTANNEKVKDTLRKFADYELYKKYDRVIIYLLTEKQKSYSDAGYAAIIQGRFTFDADRDILDYRDVLGAVAEFQVERLLKIQNILEANFGEGSLPLLRSTEEQKTETVYLNLLELFFPDTLYVADLNVNTPRPPGSPSGRRRRRRRITERDLARSALEQLGLKFSVDWESHERKIITFHDLDDDNLPLSRIIDKGTITPIGTEEFYSVDENYERVFKSLLGRCLQQKLYQQRVLWQEEERLFIFGEVDGQAIRNEPWHGKRDTGRIVYERVMKDNKPNEILHCKHLGFRTQYKRFGKQWYLMITPDWFFSYDGYKKSFYDADSIKWLKKHENNSQVFYQVKFIVYFLKYGRPSTLFEQRPDHRFLSFGELVRFDSAPWLDDSEWNPPEAEEDTHDSQQLSFEL